ncbi:MAG: 4-(cytidine 5'-diphospho)-2-C-methyl-D-erythritol kinase, partial [Bacteroidota bacterium]
MLSRPAPAKVNLGLRIPWRRDDGYHELESVFVPVAWADGLLAESSDGLSLTCSDPALPNDRGNL